MTIQHPVQRGGDRRGLFERLAENASNFTSSPAFLVVCLLLVGNFVAIHVVKPSVELELLAAGAMTCVTLLLLALLKNSELRAEHAIQRKLDAIAAALLEDYESRNGKGGKAVEDLRKAIRLEDQV
ncbi:hypothetical protein AB0M87_08135 [Streptomyces sp. NPDC051320]|uniref:hypothetical protein n=1 Tax=Streptomyces sp. NPDC051320 TaxID=3154644 RepID=UPI003449D78C